MEKGSSTIALRVALRKVWKTPKALASPQRSEGGWVECELGRKGWSEGAEAEVQRLGAQPREEADQEGEVPP